MTWSDRKKVQEAEPFIRKKSQLFVYLIYKFKSIYIHENTPLRTRGVFYAASP
jgi:hypothetical protein